MLSTVFFFLELVEKLKLQVVQVYSAVECVVGHNSNNFPIMMVVPVTEAELIGIIDSLKNKNSSEYKGVSNKIPRLCDHLVSKPLTCIFIKSLSLAIFPDRLKYVIIKPLFKKGDRSNPANY